MKWKNSMMSRGLARHLEAEWSWILTEKSGEPKASKPLGGRDAAMRLRVQAKQQVSVFADLLIRPHILPAVDLWTFAAGLRSCLQRHGGGRR